MPKDMILERLERQINEFTGLVVHSGLIPMVVNNISTYLVIHHAQIKYWLTMDAGNDIDIELFQALQARFAALEPYYTQVVIPQLNADDINQEYQRIYGDFLYYFHSFTIDCDLDTGMIMSINGHLPVRDWLALLGTHLYHDQPAILDHITHKLDTFLRLHMPQTFIERLGSITDTAYRCRHRVPDHYWWWFREGYQASDETEHG